MDAIRFNITVGGSMPSRKAPKAIFGSERVTRIIFSNPSGTKVSAWRNNSTSPQARRAPRCC